MEKGKGLDKDIGIGVNTKMAFDGYRQDGLDGNGHRDTPGIALALVLAFVCALHGFLYSTLFCLRTLCLSAPRS
jgi:hypothetical protein